MEFIISQKAWDTMQQYAGIAHSKDGNEISGMLIVRKTKHPVTDDDVFELSEYGNDRFGGRGPKKFEITQRLDQEVSKINPLKGHYVWLLTAKRHDFSFEPGLSAENASTHPADTSYVGRLSGGENPATPQSSYINDIDAASKEIFDYDAYEDSDDNVYGDY